MVALSILLTDCSLKMPPHQSTTPNAGSWRGVIGSPEFPAEPDRYHLYVSLFCPFAARVMLARELKCLQSFISMDVVKAFPKFDGGWRFPKDELEYPGSTIDHLYHSSFLHEIYFKSPPTYDKYEGKYTVPVLWDKKTKQIVNNESADILRHLSTAFNHLLPEGSSQRALDLYPSDLRSDIDSINAYLVPDFNAGVYKAGFASNQESYSAASTTVFSTMDKLEAILSAHNQPFLLANHLTELDIKTYATLIRFDTVYHQLFKLNSKMIRHDYPRLERYMKNLYYNVKGFREVTNFTHIKDGYNKSLTDLNPKAIVPDGPKPNIMAWSEEDEKWRKSCSLS